MVSYLNFEPMVSLIYIIVSSSPFFTIRFLNELLELALEDREYRFRVQEGDYSY